MSSSIAWQENPYIIGRLIYEPELFFGREELFNFIKDNLNKSAKVILLHGQRRIGKSSVLYQIPNFVHLDKFVFVSLSLEGKSQKRLSEVLHELATDIIEDLNLSKNQVTIPSKSDMEADPQIFADDFLHQVYHALQGKNLVLLLDEFDVLGDCSGDKAVAHFFPYLQSIIDDQKNLFIIPVIGRRLDDMPTLLSLFREAPNREISLLDRRSAKRLITQPALDVLKYEPDAIDAILELSAGHPYFTQVLCFALFEQARDEQNWGITRKDVERITDKAIEIGEGGLAWFWDGLPIPERVVFAAVAEVQQEKLNCSGEDITTTFSVVEGEPFTRLHKFGVVTKPLSRAEERLLEWNFLEHLKVALNHLPLKPYEYKITVELVRRWLLKRHPLQREIWQLENLDSQALHIYESAAEARKYDDIRSAIKLYKQVLEANPNHFSTLFELAEVCLEVEEFNEATELYKRAYQVEPVRTKEGFIKALTSYGLSLKQQGDLSLAEEKLQEALELEPDNAEILNLLQSLQHRKSQISYRFHPEARALSSNICIEKRKSRQYKLLLNIGIAIGVFISINAIYIINNLLFGPSHIPNSIQNSKKFCTEKQNILCDEEISFGEDNLLQIDTKIDITLDKRGVQAFARGDFETAIKNFTSYRKVNRSDPEALIYLNNAKARQQVNHLTIAVSVPIGSNANVAEEILRGVAQAQDEVNGSSGINHKLLQVAIANDNNDPTLAQQVATQFVKDSSILAVVGHNASEVSIAAAQVYQQGRLVMISPTSFAQNLADIGNYIFRTVPSSDDLAGSLSSYIINGAAKTNIAICFDSKSIEARSFSKVFINTIKVAGRKINPTDCDLSDPKLNPNAVISQAINSGADGLLLAPYIDRIDKALLVAHANQVNQRHLDLFGNSTLYTNQTLKSGKADINGMVLVTPWYPKIIPGNPFLQNAQQLWGGPVNWRTAMAYDATKAIITGLQQSSTRDGLQKVLQSPTFLVNGATGKIQFSPSGDRNGNGILVKVQPNPHTDTGYEFAPVAP